MVNTRHGRDDRLVVKSYTGCIVGVDSPTGPRGSKCRPFVIRTPNGNSVTTDLCYKLIPTTRRCEQPSKLVIGVIGVEMMRIDTFDGTSGK